MQTQTYIAVCAVAALGLSFTSPQAASAFPAAADTAKAYTQTVSGNASVPVRWGGHVGGEAMALDLAAVSVGVAVAGVGAEATEDGVAMAGDGRLGSGSA